MKKLFYYLFAATMLFSLAACSSDPTTEEEPAPPAEIKLSKESFLVNKGGTTSDLTVNVTFDGQWDYTLSKTGEGWCNVKRVTNTNRLSISVSQTTEAHTRSTTISVYSKADRTISKSISIKQMGTKEGIVIDKTSHDVSPKDSLLTIEVLANVEFDHKVEDNGKDWIEFIENIQEGEATNLLQFSIASNPKKASRKGNITLLSETNEKVEITIQQASGGIISSKEIFQVPSKQSKSYEIEIEAYAEIDEIICEKDKTWIKFLECVDVENSYNKVLKFSIEKNSNSGEREAIVTIKSVHNEETSFCIQQRGKDSVSNAEDVGGDVVVAVDKNLKHITLVHLNIILLLVCRYRWGKTTCQTFVCGH